MEQVTTKKNTQNTQEYAVIDMFFTLTLTKHPVNTFVCFTIIRYPGRPKRFNVYDNLIE